jgi:cytochrome c5
LRLGVAVRIAIGTALAAGSLASASDPPAAPAPKSFEADVKPILERSCYACHNSASRTPT